MIALVGERGREVREFIENDLGPEGLARSVVVVATSDAPPVERLRSAFVATRIAEYFRDTGQHVVLMMDSLTRVAMAQREIGLSAGEPPATRGYPPSVFALMPRLLERAGTSASGSITGLYTVLVEGDDLQDPVGDTARSILDGHVVLSRRLATSGHFPAVDVLESISRVTNAVTTARAAAATPAGCGGCWPPTATCASSSRSAPTSPGATPTPTRRWPGCRASTPSSSRTWTTPPTPATDLAAAERTGELMTGRNLHSLSAVARVRRVREQDSLLGLPARPARGGQLAAAAGRRSRTASPTLLVRRACPTPAGVRRPAQALLAARPGRRRPPAASLESAHDLAASAHVALAAGPDPARARSRCSRSAAAQAQAEHARAEAKPAGRGRHPAVAPPPAPEGGLVTVAAVTSRIQELQSQLALLTPVSTSSLTGGQRRRVRPGTRLRGRHRQPAAPTGDAVVAEAKQYLGLPYVWGGNSRRRASTAPAWSSRSTRSSASSSPGSPPTRRARAPPVAEPRPGQARRPARLEQLQPQQRRRPHRDLRRQRQDDRGAAHRRQRPPRRRTVHARLHPPDPPRLPGQRHRAVSSARVAGGSVSGVPYADLFNQAGATLRRQPGLLSAVAKQESGYNADAVSPAGAAGLMQLMPGTAKGLGVTNSLRPGPGRRRRRPDAARPDQPLRQHRRSRSRPTTPAPVR